MPWFSPVRFRLGTYDLVKPWAARLRLGFIFDAVAIRPCKPSVLVKCQNSFVFIGLPAIPSPMVTFACSGPAIDLLMRAATHVDLPLVEARPRCSTERKTGWTRFFQRVSNVVGQQHLIKSTSAFARPVGQHRGTAHANCFPGSPADLHFQVNVGETAPNLLLRKDVI